MYKVDARETQTILGYTEVFGDIKPDLIDHIKKLNVHKAIPIICELILVRDAKCNPVRIGGIEFYIPFDTVLKSKIWRYETL